MSTALSVSEVEAQFCSAMAAAGITTKDKLIAGGTLRRFRIEGDKAGSKNGWYVLHADGVPAGSFGSWKTGQVQDWCADLGRKLTRAEQSAHRDRLEQSRKDREAEAKRVHQVARERAAKLWAAATERVKLDHPYLVQKKVRAYGLRQMKEQLMVPVRAAGQLVGLQFIEPDGTKIFLTGTAKRGACHIIGQLPTTGGLLAIAEGYATGASIHQVTAWPVAVAFDCGNLLPVAQRLRKEMPDVQLVICADDDAGTPGNPGLSKAREAAAAIGGLVLVPEFSNG